LSICLADLPLHAGFAFHLVKPRLSPDQAGAAGRTETYRSAGKWFILIGEINLKRQPPREKIYMRILVVEDDAMLASGLANGLRLAGYSVDCLADGGDVELTLESGAYGLLLLDLGLPKKDGIEILKSLRRLGNPVPTLILTARDAIQDRVAGLNSGADDYLVKPFDLDELIARIGALTRRVAGRANPEIVIGELTLNPVTRSVSFKGEQIDLSAREYNLLHALMRQPGAVLSKAELEQALYGGGEEVGSNTVEVFIHHLRKKLGSEVIGNVRGIGYRVLAH
jgi:DNA-binding response OmpR family regulator